MKPIWICVQCFHRLAAEEPPEKCPECESPRSEFAQWSTNDEYRTFPRDWSREIWWTPGTTPRAGKIVG